MSDQRLPKYARSEHERKFWVPPELPRPWEGLAPREIRDRYLDVGRLRLRSILDTGSGERTYKLCKKFPSDSAYSQPIVNIYLSSEEFEFLKDLPGRELTKRRFQDHFAGHTFSVDVFEAELEGLILCEIEAPTLDGLMAIRFPAYARVEVTDDLYFTGGNLSRTSAAELAGRLQKKSS